MPLDNIHFLVQPEMCLSHFRPIITLIFYSHLTEICQTYIQMLKRAQRNKTEHPCET